LLVPKVSRIDFAYIWFKLPLGFLGKPSGRAERPLGLPRIENRRSQTRANGVRQPSHYSFEDFLMGVFVLFK
jgi:hypothetical protein